MNKNYIRKFVLNWRKRIVYLYRIYTNRCAHKAVTINYIETIIRIDLYDHVRFMQSEPVELKFDPNRDVNRIKVIKEEELSQWRKYSNYYPNLTYFSSLLHDLFTRSVLLTSMYIS